MYSFIHLKNDVFNSVLFLFELISTNTFITAWPFTFLHAFLCHHTSDLQPITARGNRRKEASATWDLIWIIFYGDDILWCYNLGFF